ncbi:hypothetical protein BT67DRAFT_444319 [Trichocladium antarcticum]|uniref:Uncharacterized protein n=1 Tax=Trichocladium antarcticum TaxID=1450529 RepID=A0AAN6ZBN6_9PEZI|nr:hypothetical protein BT67DRAFT_444319 [Trichocladium antarcticum]
MVSRSARVVFTGLQAGVSFDQSCRWVVDFHTSGAFNNTLIVRAARLRANGCCVPLCLKCRSWADGNATYLDSGPWWGPCISDPP